MRSTSTPLLPPDSNPQPNHDPAHNRLGVCDAMICVVLHAPVER
jgi:hypothetical protein